MRADSPLTASRLTSRYGVSGLASGEPSLCRDIPYRACFAVDLFALFLCMMGIPGDAPVPTARWIGTGEPAQLAGGGGWYTPPPRSARRSSVTHV